MRNEPFLYEQLSDIEPKHKGLIIALSGLQLTRKAQAVFVGKERNYSVVSTGDFVRQKCEQHGMKASFKNVSTMALELFKNEETGILEDLFPKIKRGIIDKKGVIIDSIKSVEGIKFLKREFRKVLVVGFLASYDFRLSHSKIRVRDDDATTIKEFNNRDQREVKMGLDKVVIFADYFVLADSIERSRQQFHQIIDHIEEISK